MMKRKSQTVGMLLALAAIVALTGCQAKDRQITELQRQVDDLSALNVDLEEQLAASLSGADRRSQTALQLQSQLDDSRRQLADLRRQLAAAQSAGGGDRNPSMPTGWDGTQGFRWTGVDTDILFGSGKATLTKSGESAIGDIVSTIRSKWPGKKIFIIGHTDSDPIKKTKHLWADNLDLSVNRAMTVAHAFYKLGIDKKLVYAAGQGEHNPAGANSSAATKKLNRRVVIAVVE